MRKLMMTTAIVAASAAGAMAQGISPGAQQDEGPAVPTATLAHSGAKHDHGTADRQGDDHGVDADGAATEEGRAGSPRGLAEAPAGFTPVEPDAVSEAHLLGATAHDAMGDEIGTVSEVLVDDEGRPQEVIVDVGAFLGLETRSVALDLNGSEVLQGQGGRVTRLHLPLTRTQLESLPEHDG